MYLLNEGVTLFGAAARSALVRPSSLGSEHLSWFRALRHDAAMPALPSVHT
jgi:hypothetical protein